MHGNHLKQSVQQLHTISAGYSWSFSFPLKTPVLVKIENQGRPAWNYIICKYINVIVHYNVWLD